MAVDSTKTSSAKRLRIADIKLNSLLELTKSINVNAHIDELLEIYRTVLQHKLFIGKLILLRYDKDGWRSMLHYGINKDNVQAVTDHAKKLTTFHKITSIGSEEWPSREKFEIVIPVYHKHNPLAYVFLGDLNDDTIGVSPAIKHLPFIQTLTNILVVAIENKKLAKESIRQAVLQRELDLAREIQSILVPSVLPHTHELDMDAVYLPFSQISGDYYDFIPLDESEFAICIADVSGKGIGAALLMSNFQANLLALIEQTSSLTELVIRLNRKVVQTAKGESFITFFIAKYNRLKQTLHYINAGHYPPLLHMEDTVTMLKSGCPALGMLNEIPNVKEGILTLRPPATFLTYTDGVIELENADKEEYGLEKLTDLFTTNINEHRTAKQLTTSIIDALKVFKGEKEYVDDITLLVCRILK